MRLLRKEIMLPYEIEITYRRKVERPQPSRFLDTHKINGPRRRVRYIYVGSTVLTYARKYNA